MPPTPILPTVFDPAIPALATLLPHAWFDRSTLLLLIIAAVGMAVVIKGADWLVESAAEVASRLGVSKVIIGATIVSLGTTTPEMAVSVLAAWSGDAGLALGNGVGSIIADTGLIFGTGLLLTRLPADRFVLSRQGWVQFGSAVLLAGLCYGKYAWAVRYGGGGDAAVIGRWVGGLFVVLLGVYLWASIAWGRAHPGGSPHLIDAEHTDHDPEISPDTGTGDKPRSTPVLLCWGLVGLMMVVFAGDALVQSVSIVAERWGVPQAVIAGSIVALGTSLPELVVGVTAIREGHGELLVGNVIGADILNVLFVIGFASLAAPLPILEDGNPVFLTVHLPTMLLMLVFMRLCIFRATQPPRAAQPPGGGDPPQPEGSPTPTAGFEKWMGWPLLVGYVTYLVVLAVFGRGPQG